MHSFRKSLWPLIFALISALSADAQFVFEHFGTEDGLSHTYIRQIHRDSQGMLWICTDNGLSRYDGYTFTNFFSIPGDTTSPPNNSFRSVTESADGRLWFGFWGGVATMDPRTLRFERKNLYFKNGMDKVQNIYCDSKQRIWVATWLGHYVYDIEGNLIKHWLRGDNPRDLPDNRTTCTLEDPNGRIWVATAGGLCLLNESALDFTVYKISNPPYTENNGWMQDISYLHMDAGGIMWFGGWANGLRRFDPSTGTFNCYLHQPQFAGYGAFNVITKTCEFAGQIWVASHDKGLGYFNRERETFTFIRDLPGTGMDVPTDLTNTLYRTGDVLWIGTSRGLYKMDQRQQYLAILSLNDVREGSCLPQVTDVVQAPDSPTDLLVSTWICGLFRYQTSSGATLRERHDAFNRLNDNIDIDIRKLLITKDSTLVLATSHGLFYSGKSNPNLQVVRPLTVKSGMPNENYFTSIDQANDGTLWAGTRAGILRIDPATFSFEKIPQELYQPHDSLNLSNYIYDVSASPDGAVYFLRAPSDDGLPFGITCFYPGGNWQTKQLGTGTHTNYPFPQEVSKLKAIGGDEVVTTSERGVVRFHFDTSSELQAYTSFHGLLSDETYDIDVDSYGTLWIQSSNGVVCLLKDGTIRTLRRNFDFPDREVTSVRCIDSNRVAVGFGENYLALIELKGFYAPSFSPLPVKVTEIRSEQGLLAITDSLVIGQDIRFLEVTFSALDFNFISDRTFHYTLIHKNDTSRFSVQGNKLTLNSLPIGITTVYVEDDQGRTGRFIVNKPARFYQTALFQWCSVITVGSLLTWLLLRWQRRRMADREQARFLQYMVSEYEMKSLRSQINAHFIFNTLSGINRFIHDRMPEKASSYLNTFARLLRLTIDNTRSSWVPLNNEIQSIRFYSDLENMNRDHTIDVSTHISPTVDASRLLVPPMLIQPLVENAFKHGAPSSSGNFRVHITITSKTDHLLVEIVDNGPHLNASKPSTHFTREGLSIATTIIRERLDILSQQFPGQTFATSLRQEMVEGMASTISSIQLPFRVKQDETNDPEDD